MASTFIASAVLATVLALGSSLPFAIAGPESSTAAVSAILTSTLVERMTAADPSAPLLVPVLITLGLSTIVTGIVLCGFGITRMGRAIRYVPYPVVGGFLGATGLLIVVGAIRVITGHRLQFSTLDQFASLTTLSELGAACAMAVVLYLTWHRSRNPFGLPIILVGGVIAAHVAFWIAGIPLADAQAVGWTFQPPPSTTVMLPWNSGAIGAYPLAPVAGLSGELVAVIFVTASSALFNTAGIEVAAEREANLERELNVTGLANILSGVLGGYAGCISVSRTILCFNARGIGRLCGLTAAAISVADAGGGPDAARLHAEIRARRPADLSRRRPVAQMDRRVAAAALGGRISVAAGDHRHHRDLGIRAGHPDRHRDRLHDLCAQRGADRSDQVQLQRRANTAARWIARATIRRFFSEHGGKIQGLNLQSYLFFGSANRLYQHVKAMLQRHPECRYLVFDFKLVTGIDSSAAYSFAQIKRSADERDVKLLLVHLAPAAETALRSSGFIGGDVSIVAELDHALERCENEIIGEHQGLEQEEASLRDWFTQNSRQRG